MIKIIKKDGTEEDYNVKKVVVAVKKSANRALVEFTDEDIHKICAFVDSRVLNMQKDKIHIAEMHNIVEGALDMVNPVVAKSYRDYRNYKQDFVHMLDEVYQKSQAIMYIGDKENSNSDSALVSTKRSLIFNQLNKELYQKFFMTVEELQACRDGYIYVHDMSARRDTMNCCLFDVKTVLSLLTFLPMEKINELSSLKDEKINEAKKIAAFEITKLVHGEEEAIKAQEAANALFSGSGSLDNMPTVELGDNKFISIIDAIIVTKIAPSKGQARTLIAQGGISVNDTKITDVNYVLSADDFKDGYAILKKGKKVFYKLV